MDKHSACPHPRQCASIMKVQQRCLWKMMALHFEEKEKVSLLHWEWLVAQKEERLELKQNSKYLKTQCDFDTEWEYILNMHFLRINSILLHWKTCGLYWSVMCGSCPTQRYCEVFLTVNDEQLEIHWVSPVNLELNGLSASFDLIELISKMIKLSQKWMMKSCSSGSPKNIYEKTQLQKTLQLSGLLNEFLIYSSLWHMQFLIKRPKHLQNSLEN